MSKPLGVVVEVTGEVVSYEFADQETGEVIGGLNLRVPGDTVGVSLSAEDARKVKTGEIWTVKGKASVSKKGSKLRITHPTSLVRERQLEAADGPSFDFGTAAVGGKK